MLRIRQDQVAPFEQDAIGKFVARVITHVRSRKVIRTSAVGKHDFDSRANAVPIQVVPQRKLRAD